MNAVKQVHRSLETFSNYRVPVPEDPILHKYSLLSTTFPGGQREEVRSGISSLALTECDAV